MRPSRPRIRWPLFLVSRLHDDALHSLPVVNIPRSSIYELGDRTPVLQDVSWTAYPHESWAIVSADAATGKSALFGALVGTHRVTPPAPPPGGLFPFLEDTDPQRYVQMVRFAHRTASGDGFYDFTARYGAMREGDKRTLRETFFPDIARPVHSLAIPSLHQTAIPQESDVEVGEREDKKAFFNFLTDRLGLADLLDLPMVALSNGQTRRARIAKALLTHPKLLLLDEPLTGLDAKSRAILFSLLEELNKTPRTPRIMLGLRAQDPLPEWTTHVALVEEGTVRAGKKEDVLSTPFAPSPSPSTPTTQSTPTPRTLGPTLIDMDGVSVEYGPRKVLSSIRWTIRANSRWHLIGENGAGKTTLLALLTGEHPQSYAQSAQLRLFERDRAQWPTPVLHRRIGRVSPELFNAFPRRTGLSVWDAVGTGFDGGFVPKGARRVGVGSDGQPLERGGREEAWRVSRMCEVMRALGPSQWHSDTHARSVPDEAYFARPFAGLSPGEQSMVLLMRALVGAPPVVLLDEAWAGMDKGMVKAAHRYLQDGGGGLTEDQACLVVSHWEEEVPWSPGSGVERYKLDGGIGRQVYP